MKLYRLKNDTRWNYGIRWGWDYSTMGKLIEIFCFKQKEVQEDRGAMMTIDKGFRFEFRWIFRIEKWFSWSMRTPKKDSYRPLTAKRTTAVDKRKVVLEKFDEMKSK